MTFQRSGNQRNHVNVRFLIVLSVCWSCLILLADGSSPSAAASAAGLEGVNVASPFVSAAPLIVAAVCRDGVAVVAAHTSTDDEPLLYHSTLTLPDADHTDEVMNAKGSCVLVVTPAVDLLTQHYLFVDRS
jgi:hypothetical protein